MVAQKLSATVKLPAQLTAYEVVDVYPKVTGFVKWIKVDRGSRVRSGEAIAQLEAPELLAQRAEAESKFQSSESQLSAAQAKSASDQATYQRMSAAARTPGVVAQNDLEMAQKTTQADQANVEAFAKAPKRRRRRSMRSRNSKPISASRRRSTARSRAAMCTPEHWWGRVAGPVPAHPSCRFKPSPAIAWWCPCRNTKPLESRKERK